MSYDNSYLNLLLIRILEQFYLVSTNVDYDMFDDKAFYLYNNYL